MSLEELKLDGEEITKFLAESTRPRVKNVLMIEKHRIDTEIVNIQIKAKAAAAAAGATTAAKKIATPPTIASNASGSKAPLSDGETIAAAPIIARNASGNKAPRSDEGPSSKRYIVELNEYAWDQSDKFVKMFVKLDGVQNLSEDDVDVTFTDKSMVLLVKNLNNKDYSLTVNNLLHPIDVVQSYRKIKTGMVAIYMKKDMEANTWSHLTLIEKRLKDKQDASMKDDMKGDDAIINLMKRMFQSGDAQTKQMIAKAWTESQEKMMKGGGAGHMGSFPEL